VAPKKQTIKKSTLTPTALVSGGAGFIGSHLAESLLSNNARVIVLDNYKTGKDIHIKHLLDNPNFAFYNVDINAGIPDEIESVDYVVHLAGLEEYSYSKEFVNLDSLLTNSSGTKNLLDLAKASEAKFLLVSTVDVYQGRMSQIELSRYFGKSSFDENKFSLTEAKRFAEAVVWEYFKKHDIDSRIVRVPEVYGPRMSLEASGSLGGYLKGILEGTGITVYGDGFDKEYYLYISDVVSGLVKALFAPATKGNIYSLVPESPVSALELAYFVRKMADREVDVQFKPRIGETPIQVKVPDLFNLRALDWKCKVDLTQGVKKTLEWFGYQTNQNQFKPAKFIQQKIENTPQLPAVDQSRDLFSLAGAVETVETAEIAQTESRIKNVNPVLEKKNKAFPGILPKIKMPKIRMPGIYFPEKMLPVLQILAVLFSAFCVFIALPLGSLAFSAYGGAVSLRKVEGAVGKLDINTISVESKKASSSFRTAQKSFTSVKWLVTLLQGKDKTADYERILLSLKYFSDAVGNAGAALKPAETFLEILRPDSARNYDQDLVDQARLQISNAIKSAGLAEAELSQINIEKIPGKIKPEVNSYKNYLQYFKNSLNMASGLISDLPGIVGAGGTKNYIVWFQNSNEIRPTGGFIGSYGILKMENGKLKEIVIDDIYNPDGQIDLRNIVTSPPQPIIDYLSENKMHLRNSNWNPDFTKAATEFDDLYFKVTGEKIDGYIAVDLFFVKSLLKVAGPVFLAAYNEEINADNLYERTQFHSDFNYQNGSDQKRSFLTILGSKLLEKLFTMPKEKFPLLLGELDSSLKQKHFLVYFMNNQFNAFLKGKGWDGGLAETDGDYLYVVNSNLGGTKANYYVKNKMSYEISSMTRDGLLRANLYLDYSHTGKDSAWPGGPYKNYLRVLSQNGSKLTGAKIIREGVAEEDIFKTVVISKEGNFNSFELGFTLDPSKSVRVVLSYDLPQNLSITKEAVDYSLYWQKQPGTEGDPYSFVLYPPFGMLVKSFSDNLKLESNSVRSEGIIQTDSSYFIKLQ
jgi:nucleoside-diphosphate-sugar epimerase